MFMQKGSIPLNALITLVMRVSICGTDCLPSSDSKEIGNG